MDSKARRLIDMAVKVRDFFVTRPFGAEQQDAVVARFGAGVDRAQALVEQEAAGKQGAHASTITRAELRGRILTESLRHLARIARAAAKEQPDLAEKVRVPRGRISEQQFRAVARTIAAEAAVNRDLSMKHGMRQGALEDLDRRLAEYDRIVAEGHAGRAAHTGARAEMKALSSELVAMVKQLEGMLLLRFREDPNLRGAWLSARNVAWPIPTPAEETPPWPPEPPARPEQAA